MSEHLRPESGHDQRSHRRSFVDKVFDGSAVGNLDDFDVILSNGQTACSHKIRHLPPGILILPRFAGGEHLDERFLPVGMA